MKDGPLREGILLLAGLSLLSVPLSLVTGQRKPEPSQLVVVEASEDAWVADIEVRSAHPFQWVEFRKGSEVLARLDGLVSEGEFSCELAKQGERFVVAASYPPDTPETALKVQLWVGSFPEKEFTFWGKGMLVEEVEVSFHE